MQHLYCFSETVPLIECEPGCPPKCPARLRVIVIRIQEFTFLVTTRAELQRQELASRLVYLEIRQSGKRDLFNSPTDLASIFTGL